MKKLKLVIAMVLALFFSSTALANNSQHRVNMCVAVSNIAYDYSLVYQHGILTPSQIRSNVRDRPPVVRDAVETVLGYSRQPTEEEGELISEMIKHLFLAECMRREFPAQ